MFFLGKSTLLVGVEVVKLTPRPKVRLKLAISGVLELSEAGFI